MKRSNKRQRYAVIDRSHQYRFLALVLTYNMLIVLFLGIALFLPDILRIQDQTLSLEVRATAADRILMLHARVWPTVLALICLIGMHSFRVFHRFVGPLFRFRWAFDQVRTGNLAFRVKLRTKDYLKREEKDFNNMLETLSDKLGNAQAACLQALRFLEDQGGQGGNAMQEGIPILRKHLQGIMESTGYFRVQMDAPASTNQGGPP